MRVLFWGTPEFATPPLRALLGEGHDVVGVVTQPDRPRGRSRTQLDPSPVKRVAIEEGLPVLQPERPRGDEFLAQVRDLAPQLSVVVAYGHILPQAAIGIPPMGTLNIHASLLPAWRGAAPIQAAIRAGDAETGVTIMRMVPALDAGPMLLKAPTPIGDDETYGELQMRLSELGALVLIEALALLSVGAATEEEQDESQATYAHKVEREHTLVDWSKPARVVSCQVRAYDPRPGAFSTLAGAEVKLFGARTRGVPDEARSAGAPPGTVLDVAPEGMLVACGDGAVWLQEAQPAGRRRMPVGEWHRGRGVRPGDRFGA